MDKVIGLFVFAFFFLHFRSVRLSLRLRKKIQKDHVFQQKLKIYRHTQTLIKIAYCSLCIVLVYFVLNIFFKISLVGIFTDFICGLLIFIYCDVVIIGFDLGERTFNKVYRTLRKWYAIFDIGRILTLPLFAIGLGPYTFPTDNMFRTRDLVVFDEVYLNMTTYPVPGASVDFDCIFRVYKRVGFFFKKEVYRSTKCDGNFIGCSVTYLNEAKDSAYINRHLIYLARDGSRFHLRNDETNFKLDIN